MTMVYEEPQLHAKSIPVTVHDHVEPLRSLITSHHSMIVQLSALTLYFSMIPQQGAFAT